METKFKLSIPEPCHEDWDKMTPDETGRFCQSCVKSVVDFSNMKTTEIQDYFIQNQGKGICGRFRTEQLDRIVIQIPSDVLFSQVQFHKIFLLALLVCMGTTLFSCKNENGDSQSIGKVEVVDSTEENHTMGVMLPPKDSLKVNIKAPNFIYKQSSDTIHSRGSFLAGFTVTEPVPPDSLVNTVETAKVQVVEPDDYVTGVAGISLYPDFPGGIPKFHDFVKKHYQFPKKANKIQGSLVASFAIEKDGKLDEIKIIHDLQYGLGDELTRVLNQSPRWNPAELNGKKQRIYFELHLSIKSELAPSLFGKKTIAKIDSIELVRITEFDD